MATQSVPGKIYEAIAQRTQDMATNLGLTVSVPNVKFDQPSRAGKQLPYLRMQYMPNGSSLDGLAFDGDETAMGLVQVSVYWPSYEGLLKPTEMAQRVRGWWPAGLVLFNDGVVINFDAVPVIAAHLQESDLLQVPVTIRWRASEIKP